MAIDVKDGYFDLREHVGHEIECVHYAGGVNVALECVTCGLVLIDFDLAETTPGPENIGPPGRT